MFLLLATAARTEIGLGILYPRASLTRQLLPLDGLWKFSLSNSSASVEDWTQYDCLEVTHILIWQCYFSLYFQYNYVY